MNLFGVNNHSAFQIEWHPASAEVFAVLSQILKRNYGFDAITAIDQVGEREQTSNNFRIKGTRNGTETRVLLRKNILQTDEGSLLLITTIMRELKELGANVPEIIPTTGGQLFVKDGSLYQLFSFIDGHHFSGTEEELQEMGRGLATLHRALRSLSCVEEIRTRKQLIPPWNVESFRAIHQTAMDRNNEQDHRVLAAWELIWSAVLRVEAGRGLLASGEMQPIHCDLHPHNTLFQSEKLVAIIDYERVEIGKCAKDIANACHRFVRQFIVHQGGAWQELLPKGVAMFLDAYESIEPMSPEDRAALSVVLNDELVRKVLFVLSAYYDDGSDLYFQNGEFEKMLTLLEEAKQFSNLYESR